MKFYHISNKNMGQKVKLFPRNLRDEDGNIAESKDFPPRICVAPSIAQCLLAIPEFNLDGRKGLWAYATDAKRKDFRCGTEYDTTITQEKWLLTPHLFKLEARLSGEVAIFTRQWVYCDEYGYETNLSRKDQLDLWRIRLRGIRIFLREKDEHIKYFGKRNRQRNAVLV